MGHFEVPTQIEPNHITLTSEDTGAALGKLSICFYGDAHLPASLTELLTLREEKTSISLFCKAWEDFICENIKQIYSTKVSPGLIMQHNSHVNQTSKRSSATTEFVLVLYENMQVKVCEYTQRQTV